MDYYPSIKTILAFVVLIVVVGFIALTYIEREKNPDVLGVSAPLTFQEKIMAIITDTTNDAIDQVKEKTGDVVVEQAATVVSKQFDNLSEHRQEILKEQICAPPQDEKE